MNRGWRYGAGAGALLGLVIACGGGARLDEPDASATAGDDAVRAQAAGVIAVSRRSAWIHVATEWQPFTLTGPTLVRYGAGDAWLRVLMPAGTHACTSAVMGGDPAAKVLKQCEALSAVPVAQQPPPVASGPAAPGTAVPVAALQATRLGGVAPLAVLFDASGTRYASGDGEPFTGARYRFDYGDERGATWPVSGQPKNSDSGGPIAAHVFETPGRYTVTVQVMQPGSTATSEASVTVNVLDPKAYYAGTATVCVSVSGDFAGCPAGSARRSTLPAGTDWNRRRVLLRRGEAFGDVAIDDGNAGVTVGAFGSGRAPRVRSVGVGADRPGSARFASDITVMDLAVANGMTQNAGSRVLFLRNDLSAPGPRNVIYIGGVAYWAADDPYRTVPTEAFQQAREIFLVENTVLGTTTGDGYNVYGDGSRIALLGNVMGGSMYHTVRLTAAHKTVIAHNELRGQTTGNGYHVLKIHGGGLGDYADDFAVSGRIWSSSQIVVANNVLGSAANHMEWTVAISPQNDRFREGVRDVVVAGNRFVRTRTTVQDLTVGGRNIVQHDNTVSTGAPLLAGIGHVGGLPPAWNGPYGL